MSMHTFFLSSIGITLAASLLLSTADAAPLQPTASEEGGVVVSPAISALIEEAEAGDADAANTLGFQFGNGLSVMQNDAESLKWYRKAAELGSVDAEYNLGFAYKNGFGVPQDDTQAAAWFGKAAEHGLAEAQNSLALLYEKGQGVSQDYSTAAKWYRKAAAQGLSVAEDNLQRLIDEKLLLK